MPLELRLHRRPLPAASHPRFPRIFYNEDVPHKWRHALSGVVGGLLLQLVQTVLHMVVGGAGALASAPAVSSQQPPLAVPASSPAQIMLRTVTRSKAFSSGVGLPLLPAEAAFLLSWMVESIVPPGGRLPISATVTPAPGTRAAFAAAASGDEKILLLMAQLVRMMMLVMQQSGSVAADRGTANGANTDADAQRQAKERQLLTTLLTWAMGLVRAVMTKLLQPVTGMEALSSALMASKPRNAGPSQPKTAGSIRAAARLAATTMHALLLRSSGMGGTATRAAGVLPVAARTQLMDVISLLLDMSESCVSLPLSMGSQVAGIDKVREHI